jgi:hypothetical protein
VTSADSNRTTLLRRARDEAHALGDACDLCAHTDAHGWHGIDGAAHCHDCHLTWRSRRAAHCPACCEHFTSYSASDLHDGPDGCVLPATVPGLALAADGCTWKLADQSRLPKSAASSGDSAPEMGAVGTGCPVAVEHAAVVVPV